MMNSPRLFLVLLVVLVSGAFLFGMLTMDSEVRASPTVSLEPDTEIFEQSQRARVMKAPRWSLDYRLGEEPNSLAFVSEETPAFFEVVAVRRGPDDSVYVLDAGDFSVKRVIDGEIVSRFGKGRGSGPGEMQGPMDLAVDESGHTWVADSVNGTVTAFSPDGEVIDTLRQDVPPSRVLVGPEGQVLTASPRGQDGVFNLQTGQGTESFGKLVDKPQHAIAFGGWLEGRDTTFIYGPLYFGMLFSYDFSGELIWAAETIDPIPPPKVIFQENGLIMRDPESQPLNYSLSSNDDYIFTLTRRRDLGWKKEGVIDVYDRHTGAYRFSFSAPAATRGILVAGNHLYTYTSIELRRWQWDGGDDVLRADAKLTKASSMSAES